MNKFNAFYESIINGVDLSDEIVAWYTSVFPQRVEILQAYSPQQLEYIKNKVYPSYKHLTKLSKSEQKRISVGIYRADPEIRKRRNEAEAERNRRIYQKKVDMIHKVGFTGEGLSNQIEAMLRFAKFRALNSKSPVAFELKPEDVEAVWPKDNNCPILGISLQRGTGQPTDNSPSLDKIIPKNGYVVGNIAVISKLANFIKNNATWQELERIADYMEGKI